MEGLYVALQIKQSDDACAVVNFTAANLIITGGSVLSITPVPLLSEYLVWIKVTAGLGVVAIAIDTGLHTPRPTPLMPAWTSTLQSWKPSFMRPMYTCKCMNRTLPHMHGQASSACQCADAIKDVEGNSLLLSDPSNPEMFVIDSDNGQTVNLAGKRRPPPCHTHILALYNARTAEHKRYGVASACV